MMKRMMKHVEIFGILLCMFFCISPVMNAEAEAKWYTVDGVVGGDIKFDSATGEITDCEWYVTEADIPAEIDGAAVTSIGTMAFYNCDYLRSVTIPSSVTSIGTSAFSGCYRLTSAGPNGSGSNIEYGWTTEIPANAFSGCYSLTSVIIPSSVTSIGAGAFSGCDGLTSVTIPSSVTSIGAGAFSECYSLTSATIPSSVTSIGAGAFSGCDGLTSVTILSSVTSMGESVFSGCTALKTAGPLDSGCSIEYGWEEEIPENAFCDFSTLEMVLFPETLRSIGANVFKNCRALESISIPASVEKIGASAFENCVALKTLTLPKIIPQIDDGTFSGCTGLTEFSIPEKVTSIGNFAFSGCVGLTELELPKKLEHIGSSAFAGCSKLTALVFPNTVNSIGESAFSGCTALTDINIPDGITIISNSVFSGCSSLENIVLPDGVTSIGNQAFYDCSSLEYAIIPDEVTSIGEEAFKNCKVMKTAEIPDMVEKIGARAFYDCDALTKVVIPSGVTELLESTFESCSNLKEVVIEEGIKAIRDSVFDGCSNMEKVTIPATLKEVGIDVFDGCSKLTTAGPKGSNCALEFGWTEEIPVWFEDIAPQTLKIGPEMTKITEKMRTPKRLEIYNSSFSDYGFVEDDTSKIVQTIAGFSGTKVEIYARNKGYTFEALHETILDAGYAETCTEAGLKGAWYCEECELFYGEIYHINVLSESERLILPAHQEKMVKAVKPTCTAAGNITYWYCEVCDKYFADEALVSEILKQSINVPAKGHAWEKFYTIDTPATEVEPGSQSIYCGVCDAKKEGSTIPVAIGGVLRNEVESTALTDAKITLTKADYVYTGEKIEPEVQVTVGGTLLTEDVDYTVSYENNVNASNQAVVKIKGKGSYTGENSTYFVIQRKELTDVTIYVSGTTYSYGSCNPYTNVYIGDELLSRGSDYIYQFYNVHAPGTGMVTIVGIGNYYGSASKTFQITEGKTQINASLTSYDSSMSVQHGQEIVCTGSKYWYVYTVSKDGVAIANGNSTSSRIGASISIDTGRYGTGTYKVEYFMYNYTEDSRVVLRRDPSGNYSYVYVTEYMKGSYVGSATYTFNVTAGSSGTSQSVTELEILEPTVVDSKTLFFTIEAKPYNGNLLNLTWSSSDESVAEVRDGVVTLKKAGDVVITAGVDGVKASWESEIKATDITNARFLGIDEETGTPIVTLNGELLRYGTDYTCENVDLGNEAQILKVKGCNLYVGELETAIFKETLMPVADDQLFWAIDGGKLLLYINGEMKDLESADEVPWNPETITEVELYGSIEKIGDYIFSNCSSLESITFEEDAPEFGEKAFAGSELIIYYPEDKDDWTDEVKKNYGGKLTWLHSGAVLTPEPTEEVTPTPTPEQTPTEEVTPTSVPESKEDVTKVFSDVYNDWYLSYVQYVYDNSLMTGIKGTTKFEPNTNITKAQVAQVLYNMENQPAVTNQKVFTELKDVYTYEWYANAVAWAYNTGVVTGDTNAKKFFPNADVTREQLALMMYRYAKYKEYDTSLTSNLSGLKNAENTANWALDGVKWAVGTGLVSGIEKNGVKDLAPQGNATRAQVAAILQRFCEFYEKKVTPEPTPEVTIMPLVELPLSSIVKVTAGSVNLSTEWSFYEGPAEYAIDGDTDTLWHTVYPTSSDYVNSYDDHWLQLELDGIYEVSGFKYLPRCDDFRDMITKYQILISLDGVNWEVAGEGNWSEQSAWNAATFEAKPARYVRLKTIDEKNHEKDYYSERKMSSAAEVRVIVGKE